MKMGFIFECGPQGADKAVCEYLASKLRPGVEFVSRTMDNKRNLLNGAGPVARALIAEGCERVLIVWDLRPAWPDKAEKPCRAAERKALLEALDKEGLTGQSIYLVCIEQELESWLLADENKLEEFLSTPAHPFSVKRTRHPDREKQPKAKVNNLFKEARGSSYRYDDLVHAIKIVKQGEPNWAKLRQSPSFERFETKLT